MDNSKNKNGWVQPHYDPTGLLTIWVNRKLFIQTILTTLKKVTKKN
jgi:hypothetical protein